MSCQLETIEGMKNRLKYEKKIGKITQDFYTHMKAIFNRVMLYHKHDSFEKFEEISQLVKRTHLDIKDPAKDVNRPKPTKKSEIVDHYISEFRKLIAESIDYDDEDIEKTINCVIDEVPSLMKMFEWSGISLGDQEYYRIYKAMKRLAQLSGATHLRFWGKYLGRKSDYYVLEGTLPYTEEAKISAEIEDRGIGANSHVYWVTDDLLSDWIQLPDVEPRFIEAARSIKYIVTGNLNATLNTNPKFPGKERHFLRAQIARIAHSTTLIPKEFMVPHEENEREVVFNEEFGGVPQNAGEMKSLESWCYAYQEILPGGVTVIPNAEDPEGDPTFTERLKGITEDKQVHKQLEGAWVASITGSDQQYAGAEEGTVSYA